MHLSRKAMIVGGSVLALAAGGAGTAIATSIRRRVAPPVRRGPGQGRRAEITNGGHANAVERDSENGATWEVEVTKPDGNTVDVRLDQNYQLVVVEGDSESSGDTGN